MAEMPNVVVKVRVEVGTYLQGLLDRALIDEARTLTAAIEEHKERFPDGTPLRDLLDGLADALERRLDQPPNDEGA